jgi:hypothetical protein
MTQSLITRSIRLIVLSAECNVFDIVMLSVITISVIMLSVITLIVIMLSVIVLSVIMLSVIIPSQPNFVAFHVVVASNCFSTKKNYEEQVQCFSSLIWLNTVWFKKFS